MLDIFSFDKGKLSKEDSLDNLDSKKVWIDITSPDNDEAARLGKFFNLHPLTIEDLLHANTRIKVEEFSNYVFCVFYELRNVRELSELDFILGRDFIITNHRKSIKTFEALKHNKDKLENLFTRGNDFLFHKLLDLVVDNYLPVLERLDDEIDSVEEKVTQKPDPESLKKILKIKRSIIHIKKTALPQREKISYLLKTNFISRKAIPYFRDIQDHAIRIADIIDNSREAASNTFDVYMTAVSNRMNEVMKTLSIIATIALPLTVISGIYGTNFVNLPGQDAYYGFWIMLLGMVLLSAGIIYFFKKRNWF